MRLLLHETIATALITTPFKENWLEAYLKVVLQPSVIAAECNSGTAALLPVSEMALLAQSHVVATEVAVVFDQRGPYALRVPVRPDLVESSPVVLYGTSGTGEMLARAILEPFYGIEATAWLTEPSAEAKAVVVEGAAALATPEAGLSEDLVRAWFILTAQPVVSHVLAIPAVATEAEREKLIALVCRAAALGQERRKDVRSLIVERDGVDRDRLIEVQQATRNSLTKDDQRALISLLQRGNKGSTYPYVWKVNFNGQPDEAE